MTAIDSRTATPAKLRNGSWGARIELNPSVDIDAGDTITIAAKSGKTWSATVSRVLWSGSGDNGRTAYLLATTSKPGSAKATGTPRSRRCVSDGNCSSYGNGRSCGAPDCDGW